MANKIPFIVTVYRAYFNSIGLLFKEHSTKKTYKTFQYSRKRVVREKEVEILQTAKQLSLTVDGNRLKVYEWGEGSRVAMLFHGWESNAGSLGMFIKPLLEMNYKVIAFDAPAHGESQGKRANLIYFKAAAKGMIGKFGIPDLAIGHSLGADSIIMTAYEEKINFKKVILIAPLNRLMSVFEEMESLLKIPEKLFVPFIEKFSSSTGYPFWEFYFHDYGKKTNLDTVLLFHDKGDRITNFSHAKEFAENWEEVLLVPIEGSGHYKILWDETLLKKSIEYIES